MIARHRNGTLEIRSPAKLNLTLDVLGKRPDGFHEIRSLMTRIDFCDTLIFTKSPDNHIRLTIDDRRRHNSSGEGNCPIDPIPSDERNLVVKAVLALRSAADANGGIKAGGTKAGGINIRLIKRIPSQAGLGGGSSNAAAALLGANQLLGLDWDIARLRELAPAIGSDVSFFLAESPAVCEGVGHQVTPIKSIPNSYFVVVHPPIGLATLNVFDRYVPRRVPKPSPSLTDINCLHRLGTLLSNDLQPAANQLTPWIARLEKVFNHFDLLAHQMSGSGTSYFGLCRNQMQARRIAGCLRNRNLGDVFLTRSDCASKGGLSITSRTCHIA